MDSMAAGGLRCSSAQKAPGAKELYLGRYCSFACVEQQSGIRI
jgi:hypothetical protein